MACAAQLESVQRIPMKALCVVCVDIVSSCAWSGISAENVCVRLV